MIKFVFILLITITFIPAFADSHPVSRDYFYEWKEWAYDIFDWYKNQISTLESENEKLKLQIAHYQNEPNYNDPDYDTHSKYLTPELITQQQEQITQDQNNEDMRVVYYDNGNIKQIFDSDGFLIVEYYESGSFKSYFNEFYNDEIIKKYSKTGIEETFENYKQEKQQDGLLDGQALDSNGNLVLLTAESQYAHHLKTLELNEERGMGPFHDGFRFGPDSYYDKLCEDSNRNWIIPTIELEFPTSQTLGNTEYIYHMPNENEIVVEGSVIKSNDYDKYVSVYFNFFTDDELRQTDLIGITVSSGIVGTVWNSDNPNNFGRILDKDDGRFSTSFNKNTIDEILGSDPVYDKHVSSFYKITVNYDDQCGFKKFDYVRYIEDITPTINEIPTLEPKVTPETTKDLTRIEYDDNGNKKYYYKNNILVAEYYENGNFKVLYDDNGNLIKKYPVSKQSIYESTPTINEISKDPSESIEVKYYKIPLPFSNGNFANAHRSHAEVITIDVNVACIDGKSSCFTPDRTVIPVGGEVIFVVNDGFGHVIVQGTDRAKPYDGEFRVDNLVRGGQFSHVFDNAGEYPYFSHIHPNAEGIVIVE